MSILPYKGIWPTIAQDVFIAPGAMVIGNVTLHEGVSIWYNAVIRADTAPIVIGRRSNIQDNCTLHVDPEAPLIVGEECTIGHNAIVHGATLGDRVLVGMQAVVLSHARVDSETIIAASALVGEHKHIPGGSLVMGIPATVKRKLTEEEYGRILRSAARYSELALEHEESVSNQ
ncbi:MAG TPA: gamma carbonic anhydrase family protein [Ktedonosporobacter sp.]|nr:gamma carbonic anhydrase family protein [Ktedonosporobacter sp.]